MTRVASACVGLLMMIGPAYSQVAGRISGSVTDPSGAVVPRATVELSLVEGASPVIAAVTTSDGLFNMIGVRPDLYDLTVGAPGFEKYVLRGVKVDPVRETVLPTISLLLQPVAIDILVTAGSDTVQTTNAELATTVTNEQVRRLPVLNRLALSLIQTQAGVNQVGGSATVINGQRTSSSTVTLDGINIQDNYIRQNALNYTPNLIVLDQIAEFTVTTSNANASMGGGASHITFVTPSGTNQFHGSGYVYNLNNKLAANNWFSNKDGIVRSPLNQNQVGGTIGGPIKRDRLFFYANYEAFRWGVKAVSNATILTTDARNGIFTYEDVNGQVRKVNILQAAGVSVDPAMEQLLRAVPGADRINNFRVGDSRDSLLRNTAGYTFTRNGHHNRDNTVFTLNHILSPRNTLTGSFLWNRQDVTRSDQSNDYSEVPRVLNYDTRKLLSAAWRWNPRPNITNEVRGGFNFAPLTFDTSETFGDRIISNTIYSNPVNLFRAQGRNTRTYNLMDNAGYVRGRHNFQFGFQMQQIRVGLTDDTGITGTYSLGMSLTNPSLLGEAQLPGIRASDVAAANGLLATLAGYVTGYAQTFNLSNRSSGFVSGTGRQRHYSLAQYAFYFQDAWKVTPRLALTLGLRYELPGVVDERDSISLLPRVQNNDPVGTLLSNAVLDFAGSSADRPWYRKDKNNFAPTVGLAWDVFGDGRTAFRGGYSISYVNDETMRAVVNMVDFNEGLTSVVSRTGLTARVSTGLPAIPTPTAQIPRTFLDNFRQNLFTAFGLPDPDLRTPYVQEWSAGIQHKFKETMFEVRYVGNHSTKLFRAFDVNPEVIIENGFLDDFKRVLNNGTLSRAATGVFNPNFQGNIPGSQQLQVFPLLFSGGLLNNPIILNLIQSGQAGELAATYQINGLNGPVAFYRNPVSLASLLLSNASNANYNALQVDVQRRFHRGLQFQANYTYGKVLSDSDGTASHRFEEIRDPRNPRIDRSRPSFDITHVIKGNTVYELPGGSNHGRLANAFISGWAVSSAVNLQSGNPFSIVSRRGSLLRAQRSGQNTASSTLNKSQLDDLLQLRMTAAGPYIIAASAIGSDGRATSADGTAPFNGQVFFNPAPGEIGALQRRWFSGPWNFNLDFALLKTFRIENQSFEIRGEALNALNRPNWFVDDQDINSVNFGRITSTSNSSRRIQLSVHYRF